MLLSNYLSNIFGYILFIDTKPNLCFKQTTKEKSKMFSSFYVGILMTCVGTTAHVCNGVNFL